MGAVDAGEASARRTQDVSALLLVTAFFFACASLFFGVLQYDVDVGRDFVVAELLTQGKALYRDVRYLYGPLAPQFDAVLFRTFGVSLQVLLVAGSMASLAIVLLTYWIGRQILSPTASAVAALIVTVHAVYGSDGMSYATPYTMAATYGLLFSLLTLYASCSALDALRSRWDIVAGAAAALALAAKQDFGAISLATLAASWAVRLYRFRRACLPALARSAAAWALIATFFALLVFRHASLAEFVDNVWSRVYLLPWRQLYVYAGGWGSYAWTRIPQALKGFTLNFAFLIWATCLLGFLAGLVSGDRPSPKESLFLVAAGVPLTWHFWRLDYYPLVLHGLVLGFALAARAPGPRWRAGFLAFCAAVFLFRVLPYPRGDGYGLLYFIPSLIVYLYLCYELVLRLLVHRFPARRLQAAMTAVFVACFVAPTLAEKYRGWACKAQPVYTERGTSRVSSGEAAKAGIVLEEIRRHSAPGQKILLIPYGAMYYFLTQRYPASKYLEYTYGQLLDGPPEVEEIRRLRRTRPQLVIIDDFAQSLFFPGRANTFGSAYNVRLGAWIKENYTEFRSIPYSGHMVHFLQPNF